MKLKEISKLCKATGRVIMSEVRGTQWIGNGNASFPMLGMPELDEETVFSCLDYDEKTKEKMQVNILPLAAFNLRDEYADGDKELTSVILRFVYEGHTIDAWRTKEGEITFLDAAVTKPLIKDDDQTVLILRQTSENMPYVVGKGGLFVNSLILPIIFHNESGSTLAAALGMVTDRVQQQTMLATIRTTEDIEEEETLEVDPDTGEVIE